MMRDEGHKLLPLLFDNKYCWHINWGGPVARGVPLKCVGDPQNPRIIPAESATSINLVAEQFIILGGDQQFWTRNYHNSSSPRDHRTARHADSLIPGEGGSAPGKKWGVRRRGLTLWATDHQVSKKSLDLFGF